MEKKLSIIGYGDFAKFISKHLVKHFEVYAYQRKSQSVYYDGEVKVTSLDECLTKDIIILSVPVQSLESVLSAISDKLRSDQIIIDVSSVKIKPLELMNKYLGDRVKYVLTHPLFGPESGKNGIKGLKIVLCPYGKQDKFENDSINSKIIAFLKEKLELKLIMMTPEEHDKEMAHVQALPHYVARALKNIGLKESQLSTTAYQRLHDVMELLQNDSDALFHTIQKENPFAEKIRIQFTEILSIINEELQ